MRISDWSSDVCSSDLVHRLLCEAHGALAVGDLAQEVADEQRHVLAPFGQARQVDREDGETVEEVLAETAMADRLVDVEMGGGNDAAVERDLAAPAAALDGAFIETTKHIHLHVCRLVAAPAQEKG